MSEKTANIADHPYFQYLKDLRSTIRVFDLGEHEYSGAPGLVGEPITGSKRYVRVKSGSCTAARGLFT